MDRRFRPCIRNHRRRIHGNETHRLLLFLPPLAPPLPSFPGFANCLVSSFLFLPLLLLPAFFLRPSNSPLGERERGRGSERAILPSLLFVRFGGHGWRDARESDKEQSWIEKEKREGKKRGRVVRRGKRTRRRLSRTFFSSSSSSSSAAATCVAAAATATPAIASVVAAPSLLSSSRCLPSLSPFLPLSFFPPFFFRNSARRLIRRFFAFHSKKNPSSVLAGR